MKQRVSYVIKRYLENNRGISKENIEKVVFLTDTDGCYIVEDDVHFSACDYKLRYEDDGIYTNRVEDTIKRNMIKSTNLNMINSTDKIFSIPFEIYYFSCNLDHVLHNERNLKQELKEELAYEFSDRYEGKEDEFVDFVNEKSICLATNSKKSWECIKQERNSLLKYSNVNVFFIENMKYMKNKVKEKIVNYCFAR